MKLLLAKKDPRWMLNGIEKNLTYLRKWKKTLVNFIEGLIFCLQNVRNAFLLYWMTILISIFSILRHWGSRDCKSNTLYQLFNCSLTKLRHFHKLYYSSRNMTDITWRQAFYISTKIPYFLSIYHELEHGVRK